jgi:hypothetical protein
MLHCPPTGKGADVLDAVSVPVDMQARAYACCVSDQRAARTSPMSPHPMSHDRGIETPPYRDQFRSCVRSPRKFALPTAIADMLMSPHAAGSSPAGFGSATGWSTVGPIDSAARVRTDGTAASAQASAGTQASPLPRRAWLIGPVQQRGRCDLDDIGGLEDVNDLDNARYAGKS